MADAAVFGVPDNRTGERVCAVVELVPAAPDRLNEWATRALGVVGAVLLCGLLVVSTFICWPAFAAFVWLQPSGTRRQKLAATLIGLAVQEMDAADDNVVTSEHRSEIIDAIDIPLLRDNAVESRHSLRMPHDSCNLVTAL